MNPTDLPRRLHIRIEVEDQGYTTPCWMWHGGTRPNGYGITTTWDRETKARATLSSHVLTYRLLVGEYDPALQLDHLCEIRACCNPEHLEPVTVAENLRRAFGRQSVDHCKNGHDLREHGVPSGRGRRCKTCRTAWRKNRAA